MVIFIDLVYSITHLLNLNILFFIFSHSYCVVQHHFYWDDAQEISTQRNAEKEMEEKIEFNSVNGAIRDHSHCSAIQNHIKEMLAILRWYLRQCAFIFVVSLLVILYILCIFNCYLSTRLFDVFECFFILFTYKLKYFSIFPFLFLFC